MITKNEIKELRELARSSAFREQTGTCIVEGIRSINGAILSGGDLVQLIVTPECQKEFEEIENALVEVVEPKTIEKIATTKSPQGAIGVFKLPTQDVQYMAGLEKLFIIDSVSDPGNVGTIIRSCLAFNVKGLLLVGGCDPYHPKVIRSSAGTVFGLNIYNSFEYELEDLLSEFKLYSAEIGSGNNLDTLRNEIGKIAVVFGSEADGIKTQYFRNNATSFSINMAELCESLNVAMSASIVAHELNR